jgi:uncharacterized protein
LVTAPRLAPQPVEPTICLGIDLAGVEHRETGIALLIGDHLVELTSADSDRAILSHVAALPGHAAIAINAPLTLPRGRCCLHDACRCRQDPGTRSREIERELARGRVPTLATALIKVLARRGIWLAAALRAQGRQPLEVYPFATLRLLGLPTGGKRSRAGRAAIQDALRPLVPGLDHPDASEHQLDAVVCALTARLWALGQARTVGSPDEGLMVVPDLPFPTTPARRARPPIRAIATLPEPLVYELPSERSVRRAAEEASPYDAGSDEPTSR